MKHSVSLSAVFFFLFFSKQLSAQRTAIYADADHLYKKGVELFDKQQYTSAQEVFAEYASISKSPVLKADALYYAAACGIELFNKDSEWLMRQFIAENPASTKINNAWHYLANSNYRKKKYDETIEYFGKVDLYKLNKEQLAELYFKRGYSYLQEKKRGYGKN
jgi:TolA-binding protein